MENQPKRVRSEGFEIKTTNRFGILEGKENMDTGESAEKTTQQNIASENIKQKIPPIVITQAIENKKGFIDHLQKLMNGDFQAQFIKVTVKIFLENSEEYKNFIEGLRKDNIPFYTYATKGEKPVHQVIKGLPELDPDIISQELKDNNVICEKVVRMN